MKWNIYGFFCIIYWYQSCTTCSDWPPVGEIRLYVVITAYFETDLCQIFIKQLQKSYECILNLFCFTMPYSCLHITFITQNILSKYKPKLTYMQ